MTERERWVVYPLLFLALGTALRDKLLDRTTTKSIMCQELVIVDDKPFGHEPGPRILAKIGRTEPTANTPSLGYLVVNGEVDVDGSVRVNGGINAKQYAMQGVTFIPALPNMLPNLLRALPQARPNSQRNRALPRKAPAPAPDTKPDSK